MPQDIPLPFGEWLPDLGENENPGLVEAKNVIARPGGYAPVADFDETGFTLSISGDYEQIYSVAVGVDTYFSSKTKLQVDNNAPITVVSSNTPWVFSHFGDTSFAIREGGIGGGSLYSHASGTAFTQYTAVSLRASCIARINNCLMIGNVNGVRSQFRWSAFNNPLDWAISQTTQAGVADVQYPELGPITGLYGGRFNLIFQSSGVTRLSYVGPPAIWRGDLISSKYGCIAHRSIIEINDTVYFMSIYGPCATNGASVEPIGTGRVSDYIFNEINSNGTIKFAVLNTIHAAHDFQNRSIIWSYTTNADNGASGAFRQLIYNYETNRFSRAEINTPAFATYVSAPNPVSGFQDLFALRDSDDSGDFVLSARGDTLAAEITTGYTALAPGKRVDVINVEPVYDGSGAKVAVNTKQTQAGAAVAGTPVAVNPLGIADVRASGRLAAVSVTFDAGAEWSELKGAVVTGDVSGAR